MLMRIVNVRWLVVPFAALFLLFSTGAAAAPECHVETTVQPASKLEVGHSHSEHPHSHSPQVNNNAVSNSQETLFSVGSTLNNEICIVVGFIVLLLLRFSRVTKLIFTTNQFSISRYQIPLLLSRNLGHLNLTHLQLGIIRI